MVTIADVAQAAGVSISTVSYVISGKRTISQQTRDRVTEAIELLEYSPHAGARSLASRSTRVVGLQAPLRSGVDVHVVMQIVAGIVSAARERQYDILLLTSDDASGLSHTTRASMVDALLVMDVESDDPRLDTLRTLPVPSVLIGLPAGADGVACVDFDFEAAGRLAAERLAALGHRRIALLGAPAEVMERHTSYSDRLVRGFLAGCEDHGIVGTVHACPSGAEAAEVIDEVLADGTVTGILIHNEGALPHVGARLAQHDDDLGVIVLCPAEMVRTVSRVTDSIAIPAEAIGAAALTALLGIVDGDEPVKTLLLPPVLASQTPGNA